MLLQSRLHGSGVDERDQCDPGDCYGELYDDRTYEWRSSYPQMQSLVFGAGRSGVLASSSLEYPPGAEVGDRCSVCWSSS